MCSAVSGDDTTLRRSAARSSAALLRDLDSVFTERGPAPGPGPAPPVLVGDTSSDGSAAVVEEWWLTRSRSSSEMRRRPRSICLEPGQDWQSGSGEKGQTSSVHL